jgi:hypothetical protein
MSVITDSIKAELEAWREAFIKRWGMQPPEFFMWGGAGNEDLYSRGIGDMTNPIRAEWFQRLVSEADFYDLDAIERHLGGESVSYRGYQRFFQGELIKAAKKEHDEGRPYSEEIPLWFRFKEWNIGPKWKCEERRDKELWASLGFAAKAEAADLEATMPVGRPTLSIDGESVAGHPVLAAMRREDAAAGGAGAAAKKSTDEELAWQLEYVALREELKMARAAVRKAEAAMERHLDRKP